MANRRIAFVLGLVLAAISCKGDAPDGHYGVRGQVQSVEGTGADARALIHHEQVANFKDRDGQPSRMASMSMSFTLGPGVSATDFKPGAKIAFEFDVHWSRGSPLVITRVTQLPDSTPLTLSEH